MFPGVDGQMNFNYQLEVGQHLQFRLPTNHIHYQRPSLWQRFKFWLFGDLWIARDLRPGKRDAMCYGRIYKGQIYFYKVERM